MGTFTFNIASLEAAGTEINRRLFANTKDADLVYSGPDTIQWDRTNSERLRRGLPSLTEIGIPRPPDEPGTTAPLPPAPNGSARTFEVKGPPGLTFEQAKAIFDKQVSTGSLVGYKPGDILSAATQAANGLPGAQAQLDQALSGVTGALGAGIPGATAAIGSARQLAGNANQTLLQGGQLLEQAARGNFGIAGPAVANAGELVATVQASGSEAIAYVNTINRAITTVPVTAPIDVAAFAKTTTALNKIESMSVSDVTAVVAQAKNLVDQPPTAVSNAKGVGSVGLNLQQLESAGLVKPGTSAQVASLGVIGTTLTSVLKSPTVWTGKDGITSLGSLTSNPAKQESILQDLMSKGVNDLAAVGVPVKSLSPQGLAGTALNAAKSVPGTEAFLKGLPIPNDPTGALKAEFEKNVRDGAFAVNLAEGKLPDAFKEIEFPIPADNTVNRETLNAAMSRIVGNNKVPIPNYGPIDRALFTGTKDADLVYAGDDYIVWDRVNNERLARGLPGLAEIGYPRPPQETDAERERRQQQFASG
jgi:hypothetical protein